MTIRQRALLKSIYIVLLALTFGCGEAPEAGSIAEAFSAPASLNGRTIDATVTSGSGPFATTGTFRASFTATTYVIVGDGVNAINSSGTYSHCITRNCPAFDLVLTPHFHGQPRPALTLGDRSIG